MVEGEVQLSKLTQIVPTGIYATIIPSGVEYLIKQLILSKLLFSTIMVVMIEV